MVSLAVVLDKDNVPDLNHVWDVGIDQRTGITVSDTIVVNLTARTAGAGSSHLPKVVTRIKRKDTFRWQELEPNLSGLVVTW